MISVTTTKSGSNWLDRLRTSKGFPTGDEPGLERFLASSSSSESSILPGPTRRKTTVGFAGDVSDVLSDLFNMGERSRSYSNPKKGRKQSNPKPFSAKNKSNDTNNTISNKELCSSDDLRRDKSVNGALVSSGDNSLNNNDNIKHNGSVRVRVPVVVDGDANDIDLKAYAKSKITVIDTSFAEWKSEKWVFRKNEEWKIRDKRQTMGGKKRKFDGDVVKLMNNDVGDMAKAKKKKKKKVLHLNKHLYSDDKEGHLLKEPVDFAWKVPQNRFPCPRPPEKSKPEGAPVILLKSIPTSSSSGVIKQGRKSSMKKPPKRMKII